MAAVRAFCLTVARVPGSERRGHEMSIRRTVGRAARMLGWQARTKEETAWLSVRL
jgi:hypothetical protein